MVWIGRRLAAEGGQDLVEYAGVLVLVATVVAAVASLNLSGLITRAVSCEIKQITSGGCTLGTVPLSEGSALGAPIASTAGGGTLNDRAQTERILGSNRLIDACAGGTSAIEMQDIRAPTSAACRAALAQVSPRALAVLAVVAATLQARQPGNQGNFALLLKSYLQNPAYAVIALSPRAQQAQANGNELLDRLQANGGSLWDGVLGSLCGGYGLCLGGDVLSQAYQQAYHASAGISKITTPVLLASGIAGVLKDVAVPGLRGALSALGVGSSDAQRAEQAVAELERPAEKGGGAVSGGGGAPPAGEPGGWQPVNESMSDRARAYQEQITGHPSTEGYIVNGVKFDGYQNGVLIDAKGPGYAWAVKDGTFIPNYRGAQDLIAQAKRQVAAAQGTRIEWAVAEPQTQEAIKTLLRQANVRGITVRYVPPRP